MISIILAFNKSKNIFSLFLNIIKSETPPTGVRGIFWLKAKNEIESFGLPLHLKTGVWSFMLLNNFQPPQIKGMNKIEQSLLNLILSFKMTLPFKITEM